ncbi:hypothetical protein EXIGLDRAFT_828360 [Exidia glandulosa HHB12029]|uniref:Low temperature requirement A n=1 Tax=Exidia glandulosa HHB12029 TaxID=1314781 RepID=A0A165QCZ2_EXIGL|nr:hypothetical protein EXIGLDRAFT_828360 [Exidia glandulosa HHB12029]
MVALQKLLRSFTREPDEESAADLRVVPASESPWARPPTFVDLSKDENDKLERIAPIPGTPGSGTHAQAPSYSDTTTTALPLLAHAYPPPGVPDEKLAFPVPMTIPRGMDAVAAREHLDAHAEETETGPPAWLGIFFDLAWTTTFSSLTSNTQLTTISTLFSYATFFVLAWWLWAAQVNYDTKYYTNDWYHRCMLLFQLTIFGSLAAFTKDFDPFSDAVDPKKSPLTDFVRDQYRRKCMLGISGLFAATRLLLALSYARVLFYLPTNIPGAVRQRPRLLINIGVFTLSCILFTTAFVVVKFDLNTSSIWIRMFLWFGGVIAEVMVYVFIPDVDGRLLLNVDTMGERLSGLTTIILGEGLNGVAGVLVQAASAIGFNTIVGGVAASAELAILFAFLLYFDGFKRRTLSTQNRSKMNVVLHFPLHLSLIVLLESVKNTLTYQSLSGTLAWFIHRAQEVRPGEMPNDALTAAFRNVGIDFNATLFDSAQRIFAIDKSANTTEVVNEITNKAFAQLIFNVLSTFELVDDTETQNQFSAYIQTIGGAARTDDLQTNFTLDPIISGLTDPIQASDIWIPLAGAAFLASLGVLAIVNEWVPRHRYIWASILSRWGMAITLALTTLFKLDSGLWKQLEDLGMLGAMVAIAFIVQFAVDHLLIGLAVRRIASWRPRRTGRFASAV